MGISLDPTGIGAIAGFASNIIDRFVPDASANAAAKNALAQAQLNGALAQMAAETDLIKSQVSVNQAEATNANWFVAGWRPAVGWVCTAGVAYAVVFRPIAGPFVQKYLGMPLEVIDMGTIMTLLTGMLGIGGMRTIEKLTGTAGNH